MSRKLASIQKILSLKKHENAETLSIAKILGWTVVVKTGEFTVGDEVVYCEVDSLLPKRPEFAFLEKTKYRIKTVRLRGVVSQGICFPKSILGKGMMENFHEGDDVTNFLEIIKYEPPILEHLSGEIKGTFPHFIPKTDEDRINSIPSLFDLYKSTLGYITEKLDGSSCTYYYTRNNDYFGMCSRNLELKYDETNSANIIYKYAIINDLKNKLKNYCIKNSCDIALQGELIGEKIQGNKYRLHGNYYRVFSIYNITSGKYEGIKTLLPILDNLNLDFVPMIANPSKPFASIDEMIDFTKGMYSSIYSGIPIEGIVWRSIVETYSEVTSSHRLSFKVVNPEFLLKYDG
jgi:RNA ligase (TIGR02306 family)